MTWVDGVQPKITFQTFMIITMMICIHHIYLQIYANFPVKCLTCMPRITLKICGIISFWSGRQGDEMLGCPSHVMAIDQRFVSIRQSYPVVAIFSMGIDVFHITAFLYLGWKKADKFDFIRVWSHRMNIEQEFWVLNGYKINVLKRWILRFFKKLSWQILQEYWMVRSPIQGFLG